MLAAYTLVAKAQHRAHSGRVSTLRRGLAEATRTLRLRRALSQEKLAHEAGVHRSFVFRLEKGAVNVSLDVLERLAGALNTSVSGYLALAETLVDAPTPRKQAPVTVDDIPTDDLHVL